VRLRPLVMVIDDSDDTRELYAEILRREGAVVAEPSDGHEGLRRAIETLPDFILTDFSLPVMDG
jgi:CheY-like chemotaxis protein